LGTVAGGVVQGYWNAQQSERDFESTLILRALESVEKEPRVESLQFLVDARLISTPSIRDGLTAAIKSGSVPRFKPIGATDTISVKKVDSVKGQVIDKFPELKGKNIALVGFRIRSGDIIDAVTPIYAKVTQSMQLVGEYEGERVGGTGGEAMTLLKPGHVVTGFDIQRGKYFGRTEVVHFQVTWKRLSETGIDETSATKSEKLGSGNFAEITDEPTEYRAGPNAFISDFAATTSDHTSGETFLNNVAITDTEVTKGF
jgi:hypothetical protein